MIGLCIESWTATIRIIVIIFNIIIITVIMNEWSTSTLTLPPSSPLIRRTVSVWILAAESTVSTGEHACRVKQSLRGSNLLSNIDYVFLICFCWRASMTHTSLLLLLLLSLFTRSPSPSPLLFSTLRLSVLSAQHGDTRSGCLLGKSFPLQIFCATVKLWVCFSFARSQDF